MTFNYLHVKTLDEIHIILCLIQNNNFFKIKYFNRQNKSYWASILGCLQYDCESVENFRTLFNYNPTGQRRSLTLYVNRQEIKI